MANPKGKKKKEKEESDVFDVKVRSKKTRSDRWRLVGRAIVILVATGAALAVFWEAGSRVLNELVYHNEVFEIQSVEVETDGLLAKRHLKRWSGVEKGDNLLGVELRRVRRDLRLIPWIRTAAIERALPDKLRIEVKERKPIAQVYAVRHQKGAAGFEGIILYIDEEGYVFPPRNRWMADDAQRSSSKPRPAITGLDISKLRQGRRVKSDDVLAAVRLLTRLKNSPMHDRAAVKHVSVAGEKVLKMTTFNGSKIVFATHRFDRQLVRWYTVHEAARRLDREIGYLNLSVSNNVPARWKSESLSETQGESQHPKQKNNV